MVNIWIFKYVPEKVLREILRADMLFGKSNDNMDLVFAVLEELVRRRKLWGEEENVQAALERFKKRFPEDLT